MTARLPLLILLGTLSPITRAQSCEDLTQQSTSTISIKASVADKLPAACHVTATLHPTPTSDIHAEIWLPLAGWNGKLLVQGSGGWGGSFASSAEPLRRGYATASTDDGHTGPSASFLLGHPEKLADFAYRAEHETTLLAKRLIQAFYGHAPARSYWVGCSGGGREGLIQAARFPDTFDGIIAGDPADIRRNSWALNIAIQSFKDPEAIIPPSKYPMIHRFVLDACDANDGLKDGLIGDPTTCHPNFRTLQCKSADGTDCLTTRQVQTAQAIISPAKDSTGKVFFSRLEPGTELRWSRLAGGPTPADLFLDEFRYAVYQDPAWDWRTFNLDRDAARAHAIDKDVDELDPNLSAFVRHGGKLILYHGWADQQVAPTNTVDFYKSTLASSKTATNPDWARLYMLPGMAHCSGGEGPDTFDKIGLLEQWVEHNQPPAEVIASQQTEGKTTRTRPICPYPKTAHYNNTGDPNQASSFTCTAPH